MRTISERGPLLDAGKLVRADEIRLVEHHDIHNPDLAARQSGHLPLQSRQLLRVDHRQKAAQGEDMRELRLEKGVQHRNRGGNPAQLDEQVLGPFGPLQQPEAGPDQVVADGAADAAVGEVDRVALDPDDELGIDVDRTEVIDENRGAHAVVAAQDVIEQRRLPGAEKPGDQGDGDLWTILASGH
jgi:hypothetical protein